MRFTMASMAVLALMATGCKKDKDVDTDPPTPVPTPPPTDTDTDTDESCGDNPPTLVELTLENGSTGGDVIVDTILTSTDPDGDIHEISFELWLDDVVDGTVNTSGPAPLTGGPANVVDQNGNPVDPCSVVNGLNLRVQLDVDGTNIPFNTELDFAWRVIDAAGNPSNVLVVSGYTPRSDGTDGGPIDTDPPPPTGDTGTPPPPVPTGDTSTPPPPTPTGDTGDTSTPAPTPTGDTGAPPPPTPTGDTGSPATQCAALTDLTLGSNSVTAQAQEVFIYAVDWDADVVWLKNGAATPVTISPVAGDTWDLCTDGFQYAILPTTVLAPDEDLIVHLRDSPPFVPVPGHIYLGLGSNWDLDDDRTMMLYRDAAFGGSHGAGGVEAYLKWGTTLPGFRDTQRNDSTLFDALGVSVTAGHNAIVASGDVTTAAGFTSIPGYLDCSPP